MMAVVGSDASFAQGREQLALLAGVEVTAKSGGAARRSGARLKCSGMFWTIRGANAIIALRCCRLSRRFEDYWADCSRIA